MNTLPTLTGSDKQIAWATDIRARIVDALDALRAGMARSAANKPGQDHLLTAASTAIDARLAERTDAKWWIDNEHTAYAEIKKAAADAARTAKAA